MDNMNESKENCIYEENEKVDVKEDMQIIEEDVDQEDTEENLQNEQTMAESSQMENSSENWTPFHNFCTSILLLLYHFEYY